MPGVSKEQIERAKEIDLLTYLQTYEPNSIRKCGIDAYELKEHDSLKISNGKWNWFSRGIGGKTALDFLVNVRAMDFVSAVQTLADGQASPIVFPQPTIAKSKKSEIPFELPPKHWDFHRAIAYLLNRGIDRDIINRCLENGTIYESAKFHNCVFVGKNKDGESKFACLRGTTSRFVKDIDGSDKHFSFSVPTREPSSRSLFVFESPIDALSHATLDKQSELGSSWDCIHRLSLGGTSSIGLMQYLKDRPEIDCICLCLDNDEAGQKAVDKIKSLIKETEHPLQKKYIVSNAPPPKIGKDYNDTLLKVKEFEKAQLKQTKSNEATIF